jgi:hypothetical protein
MSKRFRNSLFIIAVGVALSAPAAAQPESAVGDVASVEEAPAGEPVEVGTSTAVADSTSIWPQEIIMRVLTLPEGVWAAGVDPAADKSFDAVATGLMFAYGVTPELEVGVGYGLLVEPFEAKGSVEVGAGYAFYRQGKFEFVGRGSVGYDLLAEGMAPLGLGVQGQYTHNDKLAVVMPAGQLSVALASDAMDATPVTLDLPIGIGVQPTSAIYAQVDTVLASVGVSDADTAVFGADIIPLNVGAFYSPSNMIDVGAGVSTDLKAAGDTLAFFAALRYYGGL